MEKHNMPQNYRFWLTCFSKALEKRDLFSIFIVVMLLSSCQTATRGLDELDGTYTWRTKFASAILNIEGRNFFLKEVHASDSFEYTGKINFEVDRIVLRHASFPVEGRRFTLVFVGREQYLMDEGRYRGFVKEGEGAYDYRHEFKKRKENYE